MPDIFDKIADKNKTSDIFDQIVGGGDIFDEIAPGKRTGLTKPAQALTEDMMSQIIGLDRQPDKPFEVKHPNVYAAAKTAVAIPGLVEDLAMSVMSGLTFSLPERMEEAGSWLSRKLFGEGKKGGATGTWEKPGAKLPAYMEQGGKFAGQMIGIGKIGGAVAAPVIKIVQGSKYLAPFAKMIGWGTAGASYEGLSKMIGEGELPTPGELAKHGGTWAAIEGIMSTLGWTGRLAIGVNRLSKLWTIPKKEVLKTVIKEAKSRNMPIARYVFGKAKIQKVLSDKEKVAAEDFLNMVDDIHKPFQKQGTYQSLVKQLKEQEIESRIKSFKEHVEATTIIGKKLSVKKIITKGKNEIEQVLLKPGYARTAEEIALLNRVKAGLTIVKGRTTKKVPPVRVISGTTKVPAKIVKKAPTAKSLERREAVIKLGMHRGKILDEDMPNWIRKIGEKIRFGDKVSKDSVKKYQDYFTKKSKLYKPAGGHHGPIVGTDSVVSLPKIKAKGAALRFPDGEIITAQTHVGAYQKGLNRGWSKKLDAGFDEGFVDTTGKFLTRDQATQLYGAGETNALLKLKAIKTTIKTKPKKTGVTLGFGPVHELQNIYRKLIGQRLRKPLRKTIVDAMPKKPDPVVVKVLAALKKAKPLRAEQKAIYHVEKGKRLARALEIAKKTGGEKGYYAELAAHKGSMKQVAFKSIRKDIGQKDTDNLFDMIKESSVLNEWEKYPARKGLAKLFGEYGGTVPTTQELSFLKEVFGAEFTKTALSKQDLWLKMKEFGFQAINLPKSLMASYDLSAPLRQGLFLIRRTKQWMPAFKDMFKYFAKESSYKAGMDTIKHGKHYKLMVENKLSLTELGAMGKREEAFMSGWAERIPGVRRSSMAYSGMLNQLRANTFNDFVEKGIRLKITSPKYLESAAKYINHATGRGHLLKLESVATELNTIFFSPRLIMSRLQLINPVFYVKLEKHVRKEALKDLFALAGLAVTTATLSKMAGANVVYDPRNADFMKIRAGNKRYDILGGLQQPIRLAAQLISGKIISSTTGKELILGEGYKPSTRLGIIGRFLSYKLSPIGSFCTTLLTGQAAMGGKTDIPEEIGKRFIPMVAQDMYELYNDEGWKAIPLTVPAFFGVGLQTYSGVTSYRLNAKDYPRLDKELSRLKTSMGFPSTSVFSHELNNKEYEMFRSRAGKKIAWELQKVISSPGYSKIPNDDIKRHFINKTIDYAKDDVRRTMFKRYMMEQLTATEIRQRTYKSVQESKKIARQLYIKMR